MAKALGDTKLFVWDGGSMLVGSAAGIIPVHSHQAIQITAGRDADVRFRASDAEPWSTYAMAIVGSQQPHAMDATGVSLGFVLFVEPETREGRALTELYLSDGFASLDPAVAAEGTSELFARFLARREAGAVIEAARKVVSQLTRGIEPAVVSDERIVRAVSWINAHLDEHLTLETVAAQVFLSPGRFRHLFVEQTGMAMRPWILWRRFIRAWGMIMDGASISQAAHQAGFADAAHFTRTCNRMFGVVPSMFRVSHEPAALSQAQPAPVP
jgi:AraC-type DNA-binding domain-containing proteins